MADGVDASIPLGVSGGGSGLMQAGGGGGPLTFIGNFAATQQKLTEAKNARQTLAAKQKLGQIMATAPTMEDGLAAAAADPDVSAFVPDVVHTLAATHSSMQEYRGLVQGQTKDAFQSVMSLLPIGAVHGPEALKQAFGAELGNIPDPGVRATVAKSGGNIINWLTKDLPADPAAAQKEYVSRVTAMGLGTGTGDAMRAIMAQPGTAQLGGTTQPITQQPAIPALGQTPGAVTQVGNALTHTLAPQVAPGGSFTVGPGGSSGAGSNGLGAPPPVAGKPRAGAGASPPPGADDSPKAQDGTPLFPKGYSIPQPNNKTIGNIPVGPAGEIAQNLAHTWSIEGPHSLNNAQQTKALLAEIKTDLNTMNSTGGFLSPGSAATQRLGIGKALNTMSQMFGGEPKFNPTAVGAAENAIKDSVKMGLTVGNQMLGTQREAADTINHIYSAVPGIDNSYLGGQIISDLLERGADRLIDQYNFQNHWQSKRGGDLTGADAEFNRLHPATDYTAPILKKYGLTADGFESKAALEKAVRQGWLTPKQAVAIDKKQGFSGSK